MKASLILLGLISLWLPARCFWVFAAWESRLNTALANERTGKTSTEDVP